MLDHLEGISVPAIPPVVEGKIPMVPIEFTVVSYWHRSNREVPEVPAVRVRMLDTNGKSLVEAESTINLENGNAARNLIVMPGIPLTAFGTYKIEIAQMIEDEWRAEPESPDFNVVQLKKNDVVIDKVPTKRPRAVSKKK